MSKAVSLLILQSLQSNYYSCVIFLIIYCVTIWATKRSVCITQFTLIYMNWGIWNINEYIATNLIKNLWTLLHTFKAKVSYRVQKRRYPNKMYQYTFAINSIAISGLYSPLICMFSCLTLDKSLWSMTFWYIIFILQ